MEVGFLRKLFLRKPRSLPSFSKRVAEDFPVFRSSLHRVEGGQPDLDSATVYSLYFSRRYGGVEVGFCLRRA